MLGIFERCGNKDIKREMAVSLGDDRGYPLEIPVGRLIEELKAWRGDFHIETDLKMPMSTQDKAQGIIEVENFKKAGLYGTQYGSIEQIQSTINAIYRLAVLRDVDDIYTKQLLIQEAEQVLAGFQAQAQQQQVVEATQEGVSNEEGAQELAPQSVLAEANIDEA